MMISPAGFYEMYLKDKNDKEIITIIRGLKNKIGHLKNIIENPNYSEQVHTCPNELVQIKCNRLYLNCAKETLLAAGITYPASKQELHAVHFQKRIDVIKNIELNIAGFFQGETNYIVHFEDDKVKIKKENMIITPDETDKEYIHELNKEEFLQEFGNLYIGEWRKYYSLERFGYMVCDGTHWSLIITYNNDEKYTIEGNNAYPYNFDELTDLLCIHN